MSISGRDPYDFGDQAVGSVTEHTFTVVNGGAVSATRIGAAGLAAPFTFTGGSYPGVGGTCGATLASASSCTLTVDFAPSIPGVQSDAIEVNYNNGVLPQISSRDIQGRGVAPANITISGFGTYNFGTQVVGSCVNNLFTITNGGGAAATQLIDVGLGGDFRFTGGAYQGTQGDCDISLAPGSSCVLDVEFVPSMTGLSVDTISLQYYTGVVTARASRDVTGAGVAPANLIISELRDRDWETNI